jgi:hypothetical protein
MRRPLATALCACITAACSGSSGTPAVHPSGWTELAAKSALVYRHGEQTFSLRKTPFDGSIKDYASALTTSVVLSNPSAKFLRSLPFPDCPGEAGMQIFESEGKAPAILEIGFTVTGNRAIAATYTRPRGTQEDPNARDAMKQDVCTVVI